MFKPVGEGIIRPDALDKVKGKALYPADMEFPEMLFGGVVRSTIPFGRVVAVNVEKAKSIIGVKAIIDYTMIPGDITNGVIFKDLPVLVKDVVKRVGDPIILVIAESQEILNKALSLIEIKYEPCKGIFTIEDALKEDAPILGEKSNVLYNIKIKKGDIEKGFNQAKYVAENWYSTQMVDHGFLQTESAIARMGNGGAIEVYVATQYPHYDREEISRCLNMPEEKVKVINVSIGAAFGAREDMTLQCHAALGTFITGKPVKIVYSREESAVTHCKRHPLKMYYKTAVGEDGKLCALKARIWGDSGAYASWGINVLRKSAVHASGPYEISNVDIESMAVYTNNSFSGAMRGFGATQVAAAYESQMDILAEKLNMHPLKFRHMNSFQVGSFTATGQCLTSSIGAKKCIEEIAKLDGIEL